MFFLSQVLVPTTSDSLSAEFRTRCSFSVMSVVTPPLSALEVALLTDTIGVGNKGANTALAWTQLDLNTVDVEQPWVTLASNQFTLDPGLYSLDWNVQMYNCGRVSTRLFDVTNGVRVGTGVSVTTSNNPPDSFMAVTLPGAHVQTVTSRTTFELQYFASTTNANGLGLGVDFAGVQFNVMRQLKITKLKSI